MNLPVYILIRTSKRPKTFGNLIKSIQLQTYPNIKTIIHSDNTADKYIAGDIIIHGSPFSNKQGNGYFNLYNNRLLRAIPEIDGWFCFIDDDDILDNNDVITKLVENSLKDCLNICNVIRKNGIVPTENDRLSNSFHTESMFISTKYKDSARWWNYKSGDHYSRKLTEILDVNFIDIISCRIQ